MNSLQLRLANRFFPGALRCTCPRLVPRTGTAGAEVNCFTIYVDKAGGPYLIVRALKSGLLECDEWTGAEFEKPVEVPLADIAASDISITHFYGFSEVQYTGLVDFALGRIFRLPYARIHLVRAVEATDQYFFNKKKLIAKQRIDLLRFMVRRQMDGNPTSSPTDLMTGLYSIKWVFHPDKDTQHKRLRFYLDALVDTGELRQRGHKYELTGEALKVIEVYEEQERKHTENVKIQRRMLWLTVAIVLLTAAQAGLYKLPTLLDLSSS